VAWRNQSQALRGGKKGRSLTRSLPASGRQSRDPDQTATATATGTDCTNPASSQASLTDRCVCSHRRCADLMTNDAIPSFCPPATTFLTKSSKSMDQIEVFNTHSATPASVHVSTVGGSVPVTPDGKKASKSNRFKGADAEPREQLLCSALLCSETAIGSQIRRLHSASTHHAYVRGHGTAAATAAASPAPVTVVSGQISGERKLGTAVLPTTTDDRHIAAATEYCSSTNLPAVNRRLTTPFACVRACIHIP
jgi:hypothetical protein